MANCKISNVYVGIAGAHIRSLNSSGMVAMKDSEVTEADMERVIETAKAIAIRTIRWCCTRCRRNTSSMVRRACAAHWA